MIKLIKNALIITMDDERRVLENGCIVIEDGLINFVGKDLDTGDMDFDTVIDAGGKVVMPGLINSHNHHDQSFMKGITRIFKADGPFDWLRNFKNLINREMNKDDFYLSNMLALTEMIKNGITCNVYNISQQIPDRLTEYIIEVAVDAVETTGVRSNIAVGVADEFEPEEFLVSTDKAIDIVKSSIQQWNDALDGKVKVWAAPNFIYSASEKLWKSLKKTVDQFGVGIHTHMGTVKYGDFELADKYGFLNPNFVGVHCLYLTDKEIDIIVNNGVKVVHNAVGKFSGISINKDKMGNEFGSGLARMAELHGKGVVIGLGTDAAPADTQDMFKEMRTFAFVQRYKEKDKSLYPPSKLLELITIDAAKTLLLDDKIGSLEKGKKADLIIINLDSPNLYPILNPTANLVYQGSGYNVETVIINGEIVMENREIKTFNEKDILKRSQKAAEEIIERTGLSELREIHYRPWNSNYKV